MSRKNVFLYDIDVPEIVQEKAEIAFSMIRTEGENTMKEQRKEQKKKKEGKSSGKRQLMGILTAAACAAVVAAAIGLKGLWSQSVADVAENDAGVEGIPVGEEKEENFLDVIDNMFTLQVYAAEMEEGQPVPLIDNSPLSDNDSRIDGRQSDSWVLGGTEDGEIDYCIHMPLSCTGNNIKKVTYSINQGAFQIVQPEEESIIIDGQLYSGGINAENTGQIGGDYDEETGQASQNYETVFYQSFTLDFQKQSDEYTWINICNILSGRTDIEDKIWGEEKGLEEMNQGIQQMLDNTVITCTVEYQDGSTQSADILVSSRIMTCAEAGVEPKEDPHQEEIFITFELQGEKSTP